MILDPEMVARVQTFVGVKADRDFGPLTLGAVEARLRSDAQRLGQTYPTVVAPITAPLGGVAVSSIAREMTLIATIEVGVHEEGGENCGKRIRQYQAATNLYPEAWAWCAAFICWVIQQAMARQRVSFDRPRTAGAWDFERWAREQGEGRGVRLIKPKTELALSGDIVVYTYSHIGLCVGAETNGVVKTIEGNTNGSGGREGDGVYQKLRLPSEIRSLIRLS